MGTKIDFKDPAYYENRELSWIKFDQRVLSEANDKSIPLFFSIRTSISYSFNVCLTGS